MDAKRLLAAILISLGSAASGCKRDPTKPAPYHACSRDSDGGCECFDTDNPYRYGTCGMGDCCWSIDFSERLSWDGHNHVEVTQPTCYCLPTDPRTGKCPPPKSGAHKPAKSCP